ncbi:hypothetical protein BCR34DRAFT_447747, partial [Clohesyomyces aquaticus]
HHIQQICNKFTAFYWLPSMQCGSEPGIYTPGITFSALLEKWWRCFTQPNIKFGHFLAANIRLAATFPSTLANIVKAHVSIFTQAQQLSSDLEHYSVNPLFPAILLVCDRLEAQKSKIELDGYFSLRDVAEKQRILVVRPGSKVKIGAKDDLEISLDDLAQFALPLEMEDCGFDVIRSSLSGAVKSITGLEKQTLGEQSQAMDKSLCGHETPRGYKRSVVYDPDLWAHATLAVGEEKEGCLGDARQSVQRVRARLEGRIPERKLKHDLFSARWKP